MASGVPISLSTFSANSRWLGSLLFAHFMASLMTEPSPGYRERTCEREIAGAPSGVV